MKRQSRRTFGQTAETSVLSQSVNGFSPVREQTIMIIHAENHWVTVAAVDEELWYLDSLRPHKPLTPYVIRQLLQLVATRVHNDGKLHLLIRPTTPQTNSSDCGVYAAAYAMELVVANVKGIQASFEETLIRSHLE